MGYMRHHAIVVTSWSEAHVSDAIWAQIAGYFAEGEQEHVQEEGGAEEEAAGGHLGQHLQQVLPFDEAAWAKIVALVRSGAVPKDDPVLVARFAAGVMSPRIVALKLSRADSFGVCAAASWHELLLRARKL